MKKKSADGFISKQYGKAVNMVRLKPDSQFGKIYYLSKKLPKIKLKFFPIKK